MTRDENIAIAHEAGIPQDNISALAYGCRETGAELLERFAAMIVTKERNRIADEAKSIIKRAEARGAAAERKALEEAQKSVRKPLTDKEIQDVWCSAKGEGNQYGPFWFARAIEKAHGIE